MKRFISLVVFLLYVVSCDRLFLGDRLVGFCIDYPQEMEIYAYIIPPDYVGAESNDTSIFFSSDEHEFELLDGSILPEDNSKRRAYLDVAWQSWKSYFKRIPGDTVSLFLFDKTVVDSYSWHEIQTNYLVLQRYDLSLEDCEELCNNLSYPPNDKLIGIRKWPRQIEE